MPLCTEKGSGHGQKSFYRKRPPKDKKEENEFNGFIDILKELTPDILAIFTVDGALDKRTKASKTLLSGLRE